MSAASSTQSELSFDITTFSGCSTLDGTSISVVFRGQADLDALPHLEVFLKTLHRKALDLKAEEIVIDVKAVEFMNSSCLAKLIAWINIVRDTAADMQYRIRIKSNDGHSWQRRSMQALRCFAIDLITVET